MEVNNSTYRQLLPYTGLEDVPSDLEPKKKRTRLTKVACDGCRAKKTACDGARPVCSPCQGRECDCVYVSMDGSETPSQVLKRQNEQLRKKSKALQEFFGHLRRLPEGIAQDMLKQMRANVNADALLDSLRALRLTYKSSLPTSSLESAVQVQPELNSEYSICFAGPISINESVGTCLSKSTEDVSTSSESNGTTAVNTPTAVGTYPIPSKRRQATSGLLAQELSSGCECHSRTFADEPLYAMADPSAGVCETGTGLGGRYHGKQSERLDLGFWSSIPVTDCHAASSMSLYLETDHSVLWPV